MVLTKDNKIRSPLTRKQKISIVIYASLEVTGCCLNFPYYCTSPAQGTRRLCQSALVCLLISYPHDIIPSRGKKMCLSRGSIESGVHVVSSFVVTGCFHTGIKQKGSEADTYSHSCAEVKKSGAIPPLPHTP